MSWHTPGYESLELSTQLVIKEAVRRGHMVDVLDPDSSFIRIRGNGKVEYLLQATRTSADTYVSALVMENKKVTKLLLNEAGIRVPSGADYTSMEAAEAEFCLWKERDIVVKPNSTNFGIAVAMLRAPYTREHYLAAAKAAFQEDSTILVEKLIPGREYRFLVIENAVRGVLHRVPANVIGDGAGSIAELVRRKNDDPRRGKGYRSPLEKIKMGEEETRILLAQELDFDSIPPAGKTIYLRKNSNISTGGDSIDFTDAVHEGYKDLAVASAAAVGARICGVDMMISNGDEPPSADNYAIIELNFNPALHIHDFPYQGRNREVEKPVLDLLGL
jgi:glutamate--cysteine ligase